MTTTIDRPPTPPPDAVKIPPRDYLRLLVESYYDCQELRIRLNNRMRQIEGIEQIEEEVREFLVAEEGEDQYRTRRGDKIGPLDKPLDLESKAETAVRKIIEATIASHPLVVRWKGQKGIGVIAMAGILAWFDPGRADHMSSFWRYAGLHTVCALCGAAFGGCEHTARLPDGAFPDSPGVAARRVRGQKSDWNPKAKVHCWKVARSLLMAANPFYRQIYDSAKAQEVRKNTGRDVDVRHADGKHLLAALTIAGPTPAEDLVLKPGIIKKLAEGGGNTKEWEALQKSGLETVRVRLADGHIHQRAMRKMVKMWLSHVWTTWREIEGMPVTQPFAQSLPQHAAGYIPPPV